MAIMTHRRASTLFCSLACVLACVCPSVISVHVGLIPSNLPRPTITTDYDVRGTPACASGQSLGVSINGKPFKTLLKDIGQRCEGTLHIDINPDAEDSLQDVELMIRGRDEQVLWREQFDIHVPVVSYGNSVRRSNGDSISILEPSPRSAVWVDRAVTVSVAVNTTGDSVDDSETTFTAGIYCVGSRTHAPQASDLRTLGTWSKAVLDTGFSINPGDVRVHVAHFTFVPRVPQWYHCHATLWDEQKPLISSYLGFMAMNLPHSASECPYKPEHGLSVATLGGTIYAALALQTVGNELGADACLEAATKLQRRLEAEVQLGNASNPEATLGVNGWRLEMLDKRNGSEGGNSNSHASREREAHMQLMTAFATRHSFSRPSERPPHASPLNVITIDPHAVTAVDLFPLTPLFCSLSVHEWNVPTLYDRANSRARGGMNEDVPSPRMLSGGAQHFKLLRYLAQQLTASNLVVELGTRTGTSAAALSGCDGSVSSPVCGAHRVVSIDLNMDGLLDNAVMCGVDLETLLSALPNVDFRAVDIFSNSTEAADARALLLQADIVFVDTAHLGDFEADVYTFLHDHGFRGLLLLDDIHWTSNPAMEVLWQTVITHPNKLDLTSIGHSSGTGAVNFGGRLELLPFEVERV